MLRSLRVACSCPEYLALDALWACVAPILLWNGNHVRSSHPETARNFGCVKWDAWWYCVCLHLDPRGIDVDVDDVPFARVWMLSRSM